MIEDSGAPVLEIKSSLDTCSQLISSLPLLYPSDDTSYLNGIKKQLNSKYNQLIEREIRDLHILSSDGSRPVRNFFY
jgi:hypothetical protein